MISQGIHTADRAGVPLKAHERNAAVKRLAQLAVALGHPQRTPSQTVALLRERAELERMLAASDSHEQSATGEA